MAASEQTLDLNNLLFFSKEKNIVTGIDVMYLLFCLIFSHMILDISVWAFFFCGVLWMAFPSNVLDQYHYEIILQRYSVLSKNFRLYSKNKKIK